MLDKHEFYVLCSLVVYKYKSMEKDVHETNKCKVKKRSMRHKLKFSELKFWKVFHCFISHKVTIQLSVCPIKCVVLLSTLFIDVKILFNKTRQIHHIH